MDEQLAVDGSSGSAFRGAYGGSAGFRRWKEFDAKPVGAGTCRSKIPDACLGKTPVGAAICRSTIWDACLRTSPVSAICRSNTPDGTCLGNTAVGPAGAA